MTHPERQEQAEIVKLLRMLGASVYVLGTTRRRGDFMGTMQTAGLPDLWVVMPFNGTPVKSHSALWIEVKAPKGRLSKAQQQFSYECAVAGVGHLVGGLDAVVSWLQARGWVKG